MSYWKWKHILGVFDSWEMSCHGNMIISFNLLDPQLYLVMSCQLAPMALSLSLSLSLSSFPFLVFFLSILLSRSLHSSFFFLVHGASTTPQITSHRYHKPPLNHSNLKPEPKSQRWRRTNSDSNDSNDLNLDHSLQRTTVTLASSASNSTGEGSDFS